MIDVDLAIVGAGLAGTSAALQLAGQASKSGRRIVVFDAGTAPATERTWCYWDVRGSEIDPRVGPLDLRDLVRHRWDRWGVTTRAGRQVLLDAREAPYVRLDGEDFHREAGILLDASPAVTVRRGARVESIEEGEGEVLLRVAGEDWRSSHVIDARGPETREARLFQHFVGWDVEFEHDVLDPRRATLMDFDVDQEGAIRFLYVLPESTRRGLVETTVLSPEPWSVERHESGLRAYMDQRFGAAEFEVLRTEHGVLPMDGNVGEELLSSGGRVLRGGAAGGALRPSSGYAFLATQRWAASLPAAWPGVGYRSWGDVPAPRSKALKWLDQVFLAQLRSSPASAPELFERLFSRVDAPVLARFLTDVPSRRDLVRIMRALPPAPLAWRAMREIWGESAA